MFITIAGELERTPHCCDCRFHFLLRKPTHVGARAGTVLGVSTSWHMKSHRFLTASLCLPRDKYVVPLRTASLNRPQIPHPTLVGHQDGPGLKSKRCEEASPMDIHFRVLVREDSGMPLAGLNSSRNLQGVVLAETESGIRTCHICFIMLSFLRSLSSTHFCCIAGRSGRRALSDKFQLLSSRKKRSLASTERKWPKASLR